MKKSLCVRLVSVSVVAALLVSVAAWMNGQDFAAEMTAEVARGNSIPFGGILFVGIMVGVYLGVALRPLLDGLRAKNVNHTPEFEFGAILLLMVVLSVFGFFFMFLSYPGGQGGDAMLAYFFLVVLFGSSWVWRKEIHARITRKQVARESAK